MTVEAPLSHPGYHEALVASACVRGVAGCVLEAVDPTLVGVVFLGGERVSAPKVGSTFRRRPKAREFTLAFAASLGAETPAGGAAVRGSKLYHPAKCAADESLGADALAYAAGESSAAASRRPSRPREGRLPEGFHVVTGSTSFDAFCEVANRSSLHAPDCGTPGSPPAPPSPPSPLLVTGTGSSGTLYVTKVMRRAGVRFAHDDGDRCPCPGRDGTVSWPHAFSARVFEGDGHGAPPRRCDGPTWSWRAWHTKRVRFRAVVHLVREPLATVASRARRERNAVDSRWLKHAACHTRVSRLDPSPSWDDALRAALSHYVSWNLFVEAHAAARLRVEDLAADVSGALAHRLCVDYVQRDAFRCPNASAFARAAATLSDDVNAHGGRGADGPDVPDAADRGHQLLPGAVRSPRRKRSADRGPSAAFLDSVRRGNDRFRLDRAAAAAPRAFERRTNPDVARANPLAKFDRGYANAGDIEPHVYRAKLEARFADKRRRLQRGPNAPDAPTPTWADLDRLDAQTAALARTMARRYGYLDGDPDLDAHPRCHFRPDQRWACGPAAALA